MTRKKHLRFMIAAVVFATGTAGAAMGAQAAPTFTDVNDSFWAKDSILELSEQDIITGYSDNTFRPNDTISRAHAAVMLTRALELDTEAADSLPDDAGIAEEHSYYDEISAVYEEAIMTGGREGFRPEEDLTRAQMAAILQRAFDLESGQAFFEDIGEDYWAWNSIAAIASAGITTGDEEGNFRPGEATTRAQLAVFLDNAMNQDGSDNNDNDDADEKEEDTQESPQMPEGWGEIEEGRTDYEPSEDADMSRNLSKSDIQERWGDYSEEDFINEYGVIRYTAIKKDPNTGEFSYEALTHDVWRAYTLALNNNALEKTPIEFKEEWTKSFTEGLWNEMKWYGDTIYLTYMGDPLYHNEDYMTYRESNPIYDSFSVKSYDPKVDGGSHRNMNNILPVVEGDDMVLSIMDEQPYAIQYTENSVEAKRIGGYVVENDQFFIKKELFNNILNEYVDGEVQELSRDNETYVSVDDMLAASDLDMRFISPFDEVQITTGSFE